MRNRKVIAVLVVTTVMAGCAMYALTLTFESESYTSVFHILFEGGSHNLLGNLAGKLEIVQTDASIVVSTLTLAFSSERLGIWSKPYIDHVTLEIEFGVMFYESGPWVPRGFYARSYTQTLEDGEEVVLRNASHDISKLKEPVICIGCVLRSYKTSDPTVAPKMPSVQVYFSDGHVWRYYQSIYPLWQYRYVYPPSAIDVKLSELSGKTETTTITLTTVGHTPASTNWSLLIITAAISGGVIGSIAYFATRKRRHITKVIT